MKRRDFIRKIATGTAAAGAVGMIRPLQTSAAKTYRWKMVTSWPPKFPILQDGCERLAKNIEIMSGGRLKIDVFAGGELVGPLEVFDAVSQGRAIQCGSTAPYYYAGKSPETQFYSDYPFGMPHRGKLAWLHAGGGMALFRQYYAAFDLYPIIMISTGTQMGGWFRKEINCLADLKGLKMRIPGLAGRVMAECGVNVVNLPGSEVYASLERGVIDATEWVTPLYDERLGLHQVAKYYYYPAWHEPATTVPFIVNTKVWETLPEDLKMIVHAACAENVTWSLAEADAQNGKVLKKLVTEHQVQLRKFPDDVLVALNKITEKVMKAESLKSEKFKAVYESALAFMADFNYWMEASEWSYIDAIRLKS
ncbi:MAG: TRAP transporter substrate-binding protein [Desulfobacteraceae bacterium]|jgi:TRAP-type mannitol/chloroaromatic compound transport system substrate-binding protein|nr:TRAP transporter substrate-binding protein [Desulfobacteraceae bacterium]